jgi:Kef-type K+ transport system membrane component KefB/mannitol/fructose-specific phosphotransferase system IIA component (Ntr-type)
MESLSAHDLTIIFLALAVMLGAARLLGEIARRLHQPAVLGEILAGLILGPTILGRLLPETQAALFPAQGNVPLVLDGISSLAVTLFMLVAGMEVDLSSALRQGKATLHIAIWGMVLPFALGWGVADFFPGLLTSGPVPGGVVFPLFIATALSISALPVIAKILKDLALIKTDFGAVIVSAATINDLVGWMLFAMVLGFVRTTGATPFGGFPILWVVAMTLTYVAVILTLGRWAIHRMMPMLQAHTSWPGGVLGFALTGALASAAFTEFIGIHAIFGAFLFGVAFGDTSHLRERTRSTLDQFISFIFAPLFFASIGLKVDFISNFSLSTVLVVLVIAVAGKLGGCYLAGVLGGMGRRESLAVGFAQNARGAMEIILGLLALHAGIIDESLFVALVVMAMLTSLAAGWTMEKVLNRPKPIQFADLLSAKGYAPDLAAETNEAAVAELAQLGAAVTGFPAEEIRAKAWEREELIPTGLPGGVAIPHARLPGLAKPAISFGLSERGVDFNAPDGLPSHLVFLILTPEDDPRPQLEIVSGIAREFSRPGRVEELARCKGFTEILAALRAHG